MVVCVLLVCVLLLLVCMGHCRAPLLALRKLIQVSLAVHKLMQGSVFGPTQSYTGICSWPYVRLDREGSCVRPHVRYGAGRGRSTVGPSQREGGDPGAFF